MKIFIASDLHGEIRPHGYKVPDGLDFDVAVFAGDIGRGPSAIDWLLSQTALCNRPVLFVAGNHEFYGGLLQDQVALIQAATAGTNITFLDASVVPVIDNVRFLGCTLWTDYMFMARSQIEGFRAGASINDYRFITTADGVEFPRPFTPKEAFRRHWRERQWLIDRLAAGHEGPTVCISHHAVHPGSLHPRHVACGPVNASFISELGGIIEEYAPTLWIHGHVHDTHDYIVGGTRVVCNPRGYERGNGLPENVGFIPDMIVEIGDR